MVKFVRVTEYASNQKINVNLGVVLYTKDFENTTQMFLMDGTVLTVNKVDVLNK